MQRRVLLKQLVCLAGAAALLPSCLDNKSKSSILLKNISIDSNQEKLMAELAETIIPATATPGAKDISAHLFALMMIDDCYKKDDQQKFISGLHAFDADAKKAIGKSFADATAAERSGFLQPLEKQQTGETQAFYHTVKRLTIQAYTGSKFFLTKVQVYQLVPGHYFGCVPVKHTS